MADPQHDAGMTDSVHWKVLVHERSDDLQRVSV